VDESTGGTGPSAARRRLLDAADRLFYAHGVQAVGVDRLLAEAKVTRVTFYRHFPAKEDLVEAYLRERMARGRRRVTEILERSPDDPRAALDEIARTFVEDSTVPGLRGCEFVNASAEYSHDTDPARALAVEQRQWIRDVTADLLGRLGHPRPHELAEVLLMLRTGAVIAAGDLVEAAGHPVGSGVIKSGYDPRLTNEDLAPLRDQHWSSYNIFRSGCPTYTASAAT